MTSILHSSIRIMTPLLFAALGGLFTEMAGILNIGLEGLMVISAFISVTVAGVTGSLALGILAGMLSSAALSMVFAYAGIKLRANIFIAGIATNLLASSLTALLSVYFFGHGGVYRFGSFPALFALPRPQWTGAAGEVLLGHSGLVYLSWLCVGISSLLIYKTPLGLRIRGTGYNARSMMTIGLSPDRYRFLAVLFCGLFCGLAGASLSLSLQAHVPNVTAGRGWIALVIVYLGYRRPAGIVLAALLFGLAETLSNYSQGLLNVPAEIVLALPYLISLLALVGYAVWSRIRNRIFF